MLDGTGWEQELVCEGYRKYSGHSNAWPDTSGRNWQESSEFSTFLHALVKLASPECLGDGFEWIGYRS